MFPPHFTDEETETQRGNILPEVAFASDDRATCVCSRVVSSLCKCRCPCGTSMKLQHTYTHILAKLCSHSGTTTIVCCVTASCECVAVLSSCPFLLPRLCCQTMGWAPGWGSQTPQRSPSPCEHPFPLTDFSWAASVLTPLITSAWHVPVARAPRPGPTGFPWRRQREVRRS